MFRGGWWEVEPGSAGVLGPDDLVWPSARPYCDTAAGAAVPNDSAPLGVGDVGNLVSNIEDSHNSSTS